MREPGPWGSYEKGGEVFTLRGLAGESRTVALGTTAGHSSHLKQEESRIFFPIWHFFKAEHEDVRTFHTPETKQKGGRAQRFTGEIKEQVSRAY